MKVRYVGKRSSPLSLITGKFYECLDFGDNWCRIIDETDEDYIYPIGLFRNADTPWNGETVGDGGEIIDISNAIFIMDDADDTDIDENTNEQTDESEYI